MHRRARRLASVHQGLKVRGIGVFGFSSNIEHDTHKRSAKSKSHAKSTPLFRRCAQPTCVFQALQVFQAFFSPSLCLCSVGVGQTFAKVLSKVAAGGQKAEISTKFAVARARAAPGGNKRIRNKRITPRSPVEISQTRPPRLVEGLLDANEHTLAHGGRL